MSFVGLALNTLLAVLLGAALVMGWRLNRRLKALRDSHEGFAVAVRELNTAAARAEKGLADLRAATDEAVDILGDRIEKARALAAKLEKLSEAAPAASPRRAPVEDEEDLSQERRLGALLAAAREARPERTPIREPLAPVAPRRLTVEDDLFEDDPLILDSLKGGRR